MAVTYVIALFYHFNCMTFWCLGVPPLVSRRVLETLTYMARNHPYVAKILLELRLPQQHHVSENTDKVRGKALMLVENENTEMDEEHFHSVALLLGLLNQPLYLRSNAHLEQVRCYPFGIYVMSLS